VNAFFRWIWIGFDGGVYKRVNFFLYFFFLGNLRWPTVEVLLLFFFGCPEAWSPSGYSFPFLWSHIKTHIIIISMILKSISKWMRYKRNALFLLLYFFGAFNFCDAWQVTPGAHLPTCSPSHLFTWAHTLSHTNCFLSQPPSEMSALKGQRPCVLFGIYLRLQAAKVEKRARNIYHTYIYAIYGECF